MKKAVSVICAALLTAGLLGGCTMPEREPKNLKIGVIVTESGEHASAGIRQLLGVQYASSVKHSYTVGTQPYEISLSVMDDASDPETAAAVAKQMTDDGVIAILALTDSDCAAAAAEAVGDKSVAVLAPSETDPDAFRDLPHVFRLSGDDILEGAAAASYVYSDLGYTTAAVIAEAGNEESADLATCFANSFQSYGGRVVTKQTVTGNSAASREAASALAEADPDFVFAATSGDLLVEIMNAAQTDGLQTVFGGVDELEDPAILTGSPVMSRDMICVSYGGAAEDAGEAAASVRTGMQEWISEEEGRLASNGDGTCISGDMLLAYDAYQLVLAAGEGANSSKSANLMAYLAETPYEGASGTIRFDAEGHAERDQADILAAGDGVFIYKKTVTAADTVAR